MLASIIVPAGNTLFTPPTTPTGNPNAQTPLVPLIPILGVLVCVAMMASLPIESWERLGIWMLLGVVIYFVYGKSRSVLRKEIESGRYEQD